jgi:hypothetical protein
MKARTPLQISPDYFNVIGAEVAAFLGFYPDPAAFARDFYRGQFLFEQHIDILYHSAFEHITVAALDGDLVIAAYYGVEHLFSFV